MRRPKPGKAFDLNYESDPFGERGPKLSRKRLRLLGARIEFDSNSSELLALVEKAYAGLPTHRLRARPLELRIGLRLTGGAATARGLAAPPPIAMFHGPGRRRQDPVCLGGATGASNFVVLSARQRAALVVASPEILKFPYHARYELIEFAVFTLAARAQRLVPLHAACVGREGRGLLLIGGSGAGKSTVTLHCMLDGFDFLSEDSVFVAPGSMLATGVANFLHIRADSLRWLGRSTEAAAIRGSPVIRRRSGVEKFEVDLRRDPFRLAPAPMRIVAVVFLSPQGAGERPLLELLPRSEARRNLEAGQGYGASQPQWRTFIRKASNLDAFELRRGRHPRDAVAVLRSLLSRRK